MIRRYNVYANPENDHVVRVSPTPYTGYITNTRRCPGYTSSPTYNTMSLTVLACTAVIVTVLAICTAEPIEFRTCGKYINITYRPVLDTYMFHNVNDKLGHLIPSHMFISFSW